MGGASVDADEVRIATMRVVQEALSRALLEEVVKEGGEQLSGGGDRPWRRDGAEEQALVGYWVAAAVAERVDEASDVGEAEMSGVAEFDLAAIAG